MLGWRGLLGSTGLESLGRLGEGLVAVVEGLEVVGEVLVVDVVAEGRLLLSDELLPCLVVLVLSTWTGRGLCWTCWP